MKISIFAAIAIAIGFSAAQAEQGVGQTTLPEIIFDDPLDVEAMPKELRDAAQDGAVAAVHRDIFVMRDEEKVIRETLVCVAKRVTTGAAMCAAGAITSTVTKKPQFVKYGCRAGKNHAASALSCHHEAVVREDHRIEVETARAEARAAQSHCRPTTQDPRLPVDDDWKKGPVPMPSMPEPRPPKEPPKEPPPNEPRGKVEIMKLEPKDGARNHGGSRSDRGSANDGGRNSGDGKCSSSDGKSCEKPK